jgi:hypothetical protein
MARGSWNAIRRRDLMHRAAGQRAAERQAIAGLTGRTVRQSKAAMRAEIAAAIARQAPALTQYRLVCSNCETGWDVSLSSPPVAGGHRCQGCGLRTAEVQP